MTEDQVTNLCPKADRVVVTQDGQGWTVGLKVGDFAMSTFVMGNLDEGQKMGKVSNLYEELKGMNRQVEFQQRQAAKINVQPPSQN